MKKTIISIFLLIFMLVSCSKEKAIYPKSHYTPFFNKDGKQMQEGGWNAFLNWGQKLIDLEETITVEIKTKKVSLLKIKRAIDGKVGYVNNKSVINPINRAVILNEIMVYGTPSITARTKQKVKPPILSFIREVKDINKEKWYKINCYNPYKDYQVYENVSKVYGAKWVKADDISIKTHDVDMVSTVQMSIKNLNYAKKSKNKKRKMEVIESEIAALQQLLNKYPDADARKIVDKAIELISMEETEKKIDDEKKDEKTEEKKEDKGNTEEIIEENDDVIESE